MLHSSNPEDILYIPLTTTKFFRSTKKQARKLFPNFEKQG